MELKDILRAAGACGIAHNNGAGGEYLLAATAPQLMALVERLRQPPKDESMAGAIADKAPDRFVARDGKLFARFDRIMLVKHAEVGNIAQYQIRGEVVINHKLPPQLDLGGGEITIDEIEGLMPVAMEPTNDKPA